MANENRLKAWPGTNIAKRIAVKDIQDLERLLLEYHRLYPEHLPHGVKGVLPADKTDDFFMATDGKGLFWFAEMEYKGFNSRTDLLGGFAAIKAGNDLTRNEEYALEMLWHEIWHNRQPGIVQILKLDEIDPRRLLVETINQYISRKTYSGFIERLGGKAIHKDWVMENGYGYKKQVARLRMVFAELGIQDEIVGDLFNINTHHDLVHAHRMLADAVSKKTGINKSQLMPLFLSVSMGAVFTGLWDELNPI